MSAAAIQELLDAVFRGRIGLKEAVARLEQLADSTPGLVVDTNGLTARQKVRASSFFRLWHQSQHRGAKERLAEFRRKGGLVAVLVEDPPVLAKGQKKRGHKPRPA